MDASTFLGYNANMRSLVVDKLSSCELVVFNRFTESMDKMEFHKIVRGISRRTDIAYEYGEGRVEYDDIEDPLPYDLNAPVIELKDEDYAIWYRDVSEEPKKYHGKIVEYKGMAIVNDWITANPDLKAIFSNNDTTTIAVANVLQERGLVGEIVHVGFDATETNVVYLEEGVTSAIITQDAYDIGYQSIVAAVTLLDGGTVEPNIATNVAVVTKDNLNDESIRKILNF